MDQIMPQKFRSIKSVFTTKILNNHQVINVKWVVKYKKYTINHGNNEQIHGIIH